MIANAGSRYRVIVERSTRFPGRFEYELARLGLLHEELPELAGRIGDGVPADFGAVMPLAELSSPQCTAEQARAFALAWLAIAEGVDPAAVELDFRFLEPPGPSTAVTGSVGYGRIPRVRRWPRLKARTGS